MPIVLERLRPAIVIFIDEQTDIHTQEEEGTPESVHAFFRDLCAGLDLINQQAMHIIVAQSLAQAVCFPVATHKAASIPVGEFPSIFAQALRTVQSEEMYHAARRQGIERIDMRTQIFIVGEATSPLFSQLAQAIRVEANQSRLQPQVFYVIQATLQDETSQPSWVQDLVSQDDEMPLVNFCFLFGEISERHTFHPPPQVHYIMAGALFGLVGTGISSAEIFRSTAETNPRVRQADQRIGSFAPAMIRFPRAEITRYAANMLAEQVVATWLNSVVEEEDIPNEEMIDKAKEWGDGIIGDIADTENRPGIAKETEQLVALRRFIARTLTRNTLPTPGSFDYPGLDLLDEPPVIDKPGFVPDDRFRALLERDHESAVQMDRAARHVFEQLQYKTLRTVARARAWNWKDVARDAYIEASVAFSAYGRAAATAFDHAGKRIIEEVDAKIDELFLNNSNGLRNARQFLQALDVETRTCSDVLRDLRLSHEKAYGDALTLIERDALRPRWGTLPDPKAPADDAKTASTPSISSDAFATAIDPDAQFENHLLIARSTTTQIDEMVLTERERKIVEGLEERIEWFRQHIPTNLMQWGFVIMATPLVTLLLYPFVQALVHLVAPFPILAFLLDNQNQIPTTFFDTFLFALALLFGASHLFKLYRQLRWERAGRELVEAYRLFMVYRTEIREDQLRVAAVIGPLSLAVSEWYDTAQHYKARLSDLRGTFVAAAETQATEMFRGPQAIRDLLIGNGQELSADGYTPAQFYAEINRLRASNNVEGQEWQRSLEDINNHLRAHLVTHRESTLRLLADGTLQGEIRAFMMEIITPYLTEQRVEINYALQKMGNQGAVLWQRLLDRATMLFVPPSPVSPYIFYAGRPEDTVYITPLITALDVTEIRTHHPEWLYVGLLNQGDAGTEWDMKSVAVAEQVGTRLRRMRIGVPVHP